ncbi:hypothetical protein D3C85_168650 [compost metagenome]
MIAYLFQPGKMGCQCGTRCQYIRLSTLRDPEQVLYIKILPQQVEVFIESLEDPFLLKVTVQRLISTLDQYTVPELGARLVRQFQL